MPKRDARHIGLVLFFSFQRLEAKTGPSNLGILDKSIWLICFAHFVSKCFGNIVDFAMDYIAIQEGLDNSTLTDT